MAITPLRARRSAKVFIKMIRAFSIVFAVACCLYLAGHSTAAASVTASFATLSPTPTPVATAKPTPDESDEVIKIDTELVNLGVRVVDRNNRPVNNLQEKDFKI